MPLDDLRVSKKSIVTKSVGTLCEALHRESKEMSNKKISVVTTVKLFTFRRVKPPF